MRLRLFICIKLYKTSLKTLIKDRNMSYTPKDYKNLLGLKGFSDNALNIHFTLYEGYVKNVNSILEKFSGKMLSDGSIEKSEIQRRFAWEYNGMKLHEIYFESLSKEKRDPDSESLLAKSLVKKYGSFEEFITQFKSAGMGRGIGWVALVREDGTNEPFILWFEEHATGLFVNSKTVLCMDLLEHAFMIDYGTKKADYIDAFLEAVDWKIVEERFENK